MCLEAGPERQTDEKNKKRCLLPPAFEEQRGHAQVQAVRSEEIGTEGNLRRLPPEHGDSLDEFQ
jgi:hypothetical protein